MLRGMKQMRFPWSGAAFGRDKGDKIRVMPEAKVGTAPAKERLPEDIENSVRLRAKPFLR
jgi:hypothetical protein